MCGTARQGSWRSWGGFCCRSYFCWPPRMEGEDEMGAEGSGIKGWKAGVRRKFSSFTDMKMWWDARRGRVALNFKHCIFCLFLYLCASTCMRTCMPHAWRSGGGLRELILFHQVDPEGWTQVIRLGVQCLYSLGHLSCPQRGSLKKSVSKVKSCKSKS